MLRIVLLDKLVGRHSEMYDSTSFRVLFTFAEVQLARINADNTDKRTLKSHGISLYLLCLVEYKIQKNTIPIVAGWFRAPAATLFSK